MWPRDLLPDERYFLDVMLSRPFEGRDELRTQAAAVAATGLSCMCGCPSIALAVARTTPPARVHGMVTEGVGVDADGNYVGVMLFVDDEGYMSDLDVYAWGGDVHGRPTYMHGKPTMESFELPEWEPDADGMGATLKNVLGRVKSHKT